MRNCAWAAAAYALTRIVKAQLYGIDPADRDRLLLPRSCWPRDGSRRVYSGAPAALFDPLRVLHMSDRLYTRLQSRSYG